MDEDEGQVRCEERVWQPGEVDTCRGQMRLVCYVQCGVPRSVMLRVSYLYLQCYAVFFSSRMAGVSRTMSGNEHTYVYGCG